MADPRAPLDPPNNQSSAKSEEDLKRRADGLKAAYRDVVLSTLKGYIQGRLKGQITNNLSNRLSDLVESELTDNAFYKSINANTPWNECNDSAIVMAASIGKDKAKELNDLVEQSKKDLESKKKAEKAEKAEKVEKAEKAEKSVTKAQEIARTPELNKPQEDEIKMKQQRQNMQDKRDTEIDNQVAQLTKKIQLVPESERDKLRAEMQATRNAYRQTKDMPGDVAYKLAMGELTALDEKCDALISQAKQANVVNKAPVPQQASQEVVDDAIEQLVSMLVQVDRDKKIDELKQKGFSDPDAIAQVNAAYAEYGDTIRNCFTPALRAELRDKANATPKTPPFLSANELAIFLKEMIDVNHVKDVTSQLDKLGVGKTNEAGNQLADQDPLYTRTFGKDTVGEDFAKRVVTARLRLNEEVKERYLLQHDFNELAKSRGEASAIHHIALSVQRVIDTVGFGAVSLLHRENIKAMLAKDAAQFDKFISFKQPLETILQRKKQELSSAARDKKSILENEISIIDKTLQQIDQIEFAVLDFKMTQAGIHEERSRYYGTASCVIKKNDKKAYEDFYNQAGLESSHGQNYCELIAKNSVSHRTKIIERDEIRVNTLAEPCLLMQTDEPLTKANVEQFARNNDVNAAYVRAGDKLLYFQVEKTESGRFMLREYTELPVDPDRFDATMKDAFVVEDQHGQLIGEPLSGAQLKQITQLTQHTQASAWEESLDISGDIVRPVSRMTMLPSQLNLAERLAKHAFKQEYQNCLLTKITGDMNEDYQQLVKFFQDCLMEGETANAKDLAKYIEQNGNKNYQSSTYGKWGPKMIAENILHHVDSPYQQSMLTYEHRYTQPGRLWGENQVVETYRFPTKAWLEQARGQLLGLRELTGDHPLVINNMVCLPQAEAMMLLSRAYGITLVDGIGLAGKIQPMSAKLDERFKAYCEVIGFSLEPVIPSAKETSKHIAAMTGLAEKVAPRAADQSPQAVSSIAHEPSGQKNPPPRPGSSRIS